MLKHLQSERFLWGKTSVLHSTFEMNYCWWLLTFVSTVTFQTSAYQVNNSTSDWKECDEEDVVYPRTLKYFYFTCSEGRPCISISERERKRENMKVSEVIKTKTFILSGSPVCQGWQTPLADWLVPARMGFAVNRSQLAQSEWKEVA